MMTIPVTTVEVGVEHARRRGARVSLPMVLALGALPVVLTALSFRAAYRLQALPYLPRAPLVEFEVYAVANWIVFAVVLRVIGWARLRELGLRFVVTPTPVVAACAGFLAGLAIYYGSQALAVALGLPTLQGMDFGVLSPVELIALFLSTVITAPFCEEVLFRVLWVGELRRRMPTVVAGATAVVAFALI